MTKDIVNSGSGLDYLESVNSLFGLVDMCIDANYTHVLNNIVEIRCRMRELGLSLNKKDYGYEVVQDDASHHLVSLSVDPSTKLADILSYQKEVDRKILRILNSSISVSVQMARSHALGRENTELVLKALDVLLNNRIAKVTDMNELFEVYQEEICSRFGVDDVCFFLPPNSQLPLSISQSLFLNFDSKVELVSTIDNENAKDIFDDIFDNQKIMSASFIPAGSNRFIVLGSADASKYYQCDTLVHSLLGGMFIKIWESVLFKNMLQKNTDIERVLEVIFPTTFLEDFQLKAIRYNEDEDLVEICWVEDSDEMPDHDMFIDGDVEAKKTDIEKDIQLPIFRFGLEERRCKLVYKAYEWLVKNDGGDMRLTRELCFTKDTLGFVYRTRVVNTGFGLKPNLKVV